MNCSSDQLAGSLFAWAWAVDVEWTSSGAYFASSGFISVASGNRRLEPCGGSPYRAFSCGKRRFVVHLFLSGTVPIARKAQFGHCTRGPGSSALRTEDWGLQSGILGCVKSLRSYAFAYVSNRCEGLLSQGLCNEAILLGCSTGVE